VRNTLQYKNSPFGSVTTLGRVLNVSPRHLQALAARAPEMYPVARDGIIVKEDGSIKVIYNPAPPIKQVQQKMIAAIFDCVVFPAYINGGIKRRNYRDDCLLHTEAKIVINLDISTFFESISAHEVKKLWQYFFNLPPKVADLLTRLTTYRGHLPRGAPASSYLANLMFWDIEPKLEAILRKRGIIYSRYIDDVSLSSKRVLTHQEIGSAIGQVYGMFFRKGVQPNRVKQKITFSSKAVRVHNINVNDVVPTIPKQVRREIRAAVYNLVKSIEQHGFNPEMQTHFRHVYGKVIWVKQFHPDEGKSQQDKLMAAVSLTEVYGT
jgi:hypothetical protein